MNQVETQAKNEMQKNPIYNEAGINDSEKFTYAEAVPRLISKIKRCN